MDLTEAFAPVSWDGGASYSDTALGSANTALLVEKMLHLRGKTGNFFATDATVERTAEDLDEAAESFSCTQLVKSFGVARDLLEKLGTEREALKARLASVIACKETLGATFQATAKLYNAMGLVVERGPEAAVMEDAATAVAQAEAALQVVVKREEVLRRRLEPARAIIGMAAKKLVGDGAETMTVMHCPVCFEREVDTAWGCGHTVCGGCLDKASDKRCVVCRTGGPAFRLFFLNGPTSAPPADPAPVLSVHSVGERPMPRMTRM